jgi:hypothetical protein
MAESRNNGARRNYPLLGYNWINQHCWATNKHVTTEEFLEAVFSIKSTPRPYNEEQRDTRVSLESAFGECRSRVASAWLAAKNLHA